MRPRSWTKQQLEDAIIKSRSYRSVLSKLGLREAGGNYAQIRKYIAEHKLNIDHFKGQGWNAGLKGIGKPLVLLENILVKGSNFQSFKLKKRLFAAKLKPQHCEECGWDNISEDGRLPLELDHINGDSRDNRLENLRVLCPNCHSLKRTHRGRNKRNAGRVAERHTHDT